MRSDNLRRHVRSHFFDKSKCIPTKLENMQLATGEWVTKPFWSCERISGDPTHPYTPNPEDKSGETETPQFMLKMVEQGYKVPWVYQRFGQLAVDIYCRRHGKNPSLTKQLTFSDVLRWWGRW